MADAVVQTQTTASTTPAAPAAATGAAPATTAAASTLLGAAVPADPAKPADVATTAATDTKLADGAAKADASNPASAAPEKYEITIPEDLAKAGMQADTGMIEAVSPILKELNLSNEQANKLAGAYAAYAAQAQKAQHDQVAATLEGWKQEVLAWPRAQETLAVTRQAVLKYGGEHAANAFFSDPYLGSNPVVLRVLANMAARLGEDRMQDRAISAEGTKRDPAEILFGKK